MTTTINKKLHVIIAGGGTGGHIFPGLAIADALKKLMPDIEILFVGANGKMEMDKIPAAGFKIKGIDIAGYNRSSILKNIGLPLKLIKSYFQVKKILKDFSPDAVIGVGGYSSFPVLRAAQSKGIPTFIHESNSLPGKSNKYLASKARLVFVANEGLEKYFSKARLFVSGNPVRKQLLDAADKVKALQFFGLKPEIKTVLVSGGSLGARSINETIAENIDVFKKNNIQLIWQTGKSFSGDAARKEEEMTNIWTNAFIDRMDLAYAAADVVIARAGAMTIAELKVQKKAAILVPYPFAAEDHQTVNAKQLVNQNAALLVANQDAKEHLIPVMLQLIQDEHRIKELEQNIGKMAIKNADEVIASKILNVIEQE